MFMNLLECQTEMLMQKFNEMLINHECIPYISVSLKTKQSKVSVYLNSYIAFIQINLGIYLCTCHKTLNQNMNDNIFFLGCNVAGHQRTFVFQYKQRCLKV